MGFILVSDLLNVIQNSININNIEDVYNYILNQLLEKYYTTLGILFIPQPRLINLPVKQITSTASPITGIATLSTISVHQIAKGTQIA